MSALVKTSTRQKSCLDCVRSKRKCDQGFPKCRRCVKRRVECQYIAKSPNRLLKGDEETHGNTEGQAAELAAEAATPSSLQLQRSPSPIRGLTPFLTDPFMELANDPFNLPSLPLDDFLSPAVVSDIMADPILDNPELAAGPNYQRRVEYVARRIARMPKTFAETAQAPFIHRRLLQDREPAPPPPLQDALSACALYSLKNPHNQALVFRNLEAKACQLIVATADPFRLSRRDLLAALQALLLYQIVRLFDGDIRLRMQAEADEATLLTWTNALRARMRQVGPAGPALPPTPSAAATPSRQQSRPPDWLHWLLEESIRRTVFISIMLKALYAYLKFGYDEFNLKGLGITAQAALWDAQSEFGWRTAYCERDRLEMRLAHWESDLATAGPDDLEELGVLIMAAYRGLESTAEWLGKSHVARYGLE
ncbi:hypothetical protein B0J12DRAFT_678674 [Macrophomina phaseolina]|uniref:Zn(2)-C6 fungal-type domain-containing protein n=1 Tax=Macrophomina phaseolina TaxID=35725 RepID=A0ABQ8FY66_9PEZI|nr:hypothetical protein B0J12DRAFT_678674 [Macrophomina phaseolina]